MLVVVTLARLKWRDAMDLLDSELSHIYDHDKRCCACTWQDFGPKLVTWSWWKRMILLWKLWSLATTGKSTEYNDSVRIIGWSHLLSQVVPEDKDGASNFGFLDPSTVLRGCHLVLAFSGGRTNQNLNTTQFANCCTSPRRNRWLEELLRDNVSVV